MKTKRRKKKMGQPTLVCGIYLDQVAMKFLKRGRCVNCPQSLLSSHLPNSPLLIICPHHTRQEGEGAIQVSDL
jgi:hypothetical protein